MSSKPHRLKLTFDGGYLTAKLICPESGCQPATTCSGCGRDIRETEGKRCYDCKDGVGDPDECWMQPWMGELMIEEILNAEIEIPVTGEWDGEGLVLHQLVETEARP